MRQEPRQFEMPKQRVRPTTRQSNQGAPQKHGQSPYNRNSTTDTADEWRSTRGLTEGMSAKEIVQTFLACLVAVLAAKGLLDLFAWCVGHFIKGWW